MKRSSPTQHQKHNAQYLRTIQTKRHFFVPRWFLYNLPGGFINHLGLSAWHLRYTYFFRYPLSRPIQGDTGQKPERETSQFNDILRSREVTYAEMDWKVIVDDKFVPPTLGSWSLQFKITFHLFAFRNLRTFSLILFPLQTELVMFR